MEINYSNKPPLQQSTADNLIRRFLPGRPINSIIQPKFMFSGKCLHLIFLFEQLNIDIYISCRFSSSMQTEKEKINSNAPVKY